MQYPKISIVTPSFNQGAFIEETILSVLEQDYPELEYIVMDGGSTDNTVEVLKKYGDRISYWVSEGDSGQSEAINKGFKRATGEILSWLCSDDLYLPGTLKKVAEVFANNMNSIMIHGKAVLFDAQGKEEIKAADLKDIQLRYYSVIPFPQPSSFFKRKLIEEQGLLREDLHFAMDYDLLIRAALNYEITPVDAILSKYRLHDESKTVTQIRKFEQEWVLVFSKFIRSVKGGEGYIDALRECELYIDGKDVYPHQHLFTPHDIRLVMLYFLDFMSHLSYQFLDLKMASQRLALIRSMDGDFFASRDLKKIAVRAKYYPASLIKLFRNITGKWQLSS